MHQLREMLPLHGKTHAERTKQMKNWKTTVMGSVAGLPQIITGIISKDWGSVITGVATILMGIFAKDSNVTGGMVQQ